MIYHRDIKPSNIVFFSDSMRYKIIDFGEAERIEKKKVININE